MQNLGFTFQQLRAFIAVAEELHFGRAADRLFISQPPLSRSIQSLEHRLGVMLLERTSRSVTLTPAGEVFQQHAVSILSAVDDARRAAREVDARPQRTIRMGYVEPMAFDLLPRTLARFRDEHPAVDVELHEMHSHEQIRALKANELDIALVRPPFDLHGLDVRHAFDDPLVLAVREGHRIGADPVSVRSLADEEFVTYVDARGEGIPCAFVQTCHDAGFSPTVRTRASSTPMLMSVLASSDAVAMVSSELARMPRPGVRFVPIVDPVPLSPVSFAWRSSDPHRAYVVLGDCFRDVADTRNEPDGPVPVGAGPSGSLPIARLRPPAGSRARR